MWTVTIAAAAWLCCEIAIAWLCKPTLNKEASVDSPSDIELIALAKGNERYVFLYRPDQAVEVRRKFGQFASNPELNFTWCDAAVLSQEVRKRMARRAVEQKRIAEGREEMDVLENIRRGKPR